MPPHTTTTATSTTEVTNTSAAQPAGSLAEERDVLCLQAVIEAQAAELAQLREQIWLRDVALDASPTTCFISKLRDPESIIVYCNQALADNYGYQRHELIGTGIKKIIPLSWNDERQQQIRDALRAGETFQFEEQIPKKDGTYLWVAFSVMPIADHTGRITHSMCVSSDITLTRDAIQSQQSTQAQLIAELQERERLLVQLSVAQKLESVGRLAAGVAHEINTPIQYVTDSVYFLRSAFEDIERLITTYRQASEQIVSDPTATQQALLEATTACDLDFLLDEIPKAFERTFDGTNRVTTIVRAMKEFSHPDAAEFSEADLNRALQTTLVVASNEYKYYAKIKTIFDPELPMVSCNIDELNQVFLNLIVNAAHAIHDSGKDSSSGEIIITSAVDGDHVLLTISDNGCGIPQENLDKIFDPFFTTKEVGRGTGQGLSITRSIVVNKHGGEVNATSTVGVGTQFTLRLPINRQQTELTA